MQKWSLSLIFILLLAFGLACANEPQVVDQTSTSSLSAEQVEQIVSKALEAQAMETAAAPAGPTSEEIGAIVSEAVAEATSSSLSAEQVETQPGPSLAERYLHRLEQATLSGNPSQTRRNLV